MPVTPVEQLFSVKGKSALVTGASSGIGAHLAEMLSFHGANVVAGARREGKLADVVGVINSHKEKNLEAGSAVAIALDVSEGVGAVKGAVERAWAAFGGIDILINNAGVAHTGSILDGSEEDWDAQFATNVKGVYAVSSAVAKRMLQEGKKGSIINISSMAGNPGGAVANMAAYSSTKAAVQQLTRSMALDLSHHGIRVNSISPGPFPSEMSASLLEKESVKKYISEECPARRFGNTEKDLDGSVLLLASEAGAYITGINVTVDGGCSLVLKGF
eukprot:TRINITY_DN13755_c0_g1_i1.p1 TRINITY_DN13755_c0_g1~~TRINITY_DN13755_c0_g1_i1.p1  ORF type:complete len:274 (-),score=52.92 TRINITY_DN13755_c0_g1_i1:455-1276(-)